MGYYSHYSKWHDHTNPKYVKFIKRKFTTTFEDYLPEDKNAAILEIGCANGMALSALKDMGYNNLLGIEIDPQLAEIARSLSLKVETQDAAGFVKETKKKFDFIYLFDVLEHFELDKIPEILGDLYEILNKNGKLMMIVPNATSPAGSYFRYIDWTHNVSFTPTSISYLLEEAGFKDITISDESIIQEPIKEYFEKPEHYNYAKHLSEKARFYEAFARWEMTCMFGPSKYNLLIAPNMKIVACKKNLEKVDLKIKAKNEDLFDLQEFSKQVTSNRLELEDLKNRLTIKQENLNNDIDRLKKHIVKIKNEINENNIKVSSKIVELENRMNIINDEIKKIEYILLKLNKLTESILDINKKIVSIENYVKKQREIVELNAFENLLLKNQIEQSFSSIRTALEGIKRLDDSIVNLCKLTLLKKRKKFWWKILFILKAYKLRRIIQNSNYFDEEYYLQNNPDVKQSGMDPILHYLIYGAYEGRNPSKNFNTDKYIKSHLEVLLDDINPLVHRIIYGESK